MNKRLTLRYDEDLQKIVHYLRMEVGLNISHIVRRYLMNLYETEKARRSV